MTGTGTLPPEAEEVLREGRSLRTNTKSINATQNQSTRHTHQQRAAVLTNATHVMQRGVSSEFCQPELGASETLATLFFFSGRTESVCVFFTSFLT